MDKDIEELEQKLEQKKRESTEISVIQEQPSEIVEIQKQSQLVSELVNNESAIEIAKQQYQDLKNQKEIAKKMGNVVNKKTNADIETADLLVEDQMVSNKVKKAEQRNKLLKLKNDRKYLMKEQKHRLEMQRQAHLRDKYEDLLLRTCRKKQKTNDGKWEFVNDENGKPIINIPSPFKFFWIRVFDGFVSILNLTAEIFGALNKNVLRGGFIILVLLMLFVPAFRTWVLSLIGIHI